ncbi:hypothetical protein [Atlantibacter hermannii]|uniref:Uncharacterized protein n=2 Tax=Atlantibacter hermannii TaxID=565 RepID=H5V0Y2_ATLHE|nr:hypothetical protein [Atlantibacter hermannii]MCQ4968282.1 Rha family transcriptional regulator [Enterobacteriaceae bacterium DFI.7.85]MDU7812794.1 hypothetical protein [Atlantibacter hermannii]GAB51640.1 hypothetical protein EH105704_03_01450 [Atlantibacter hermannii NBRC 105704]VDZ74120.1 Uncharacterised protein [Atlantibacter hermannii]
MQLVEIKKLDLVTNTAAIADGVGRDHDAIIKLVDRNNIDLEEFGTVGFEIRKSGGKPLRIALLNEQQTTLLKETKLLSPTVDTDSVRQGVRSFRKGDDRKYQNFLCLI